jgi:hypothetical protein
MTILTREPVLVIALVAALLNAAVLFGLDLTTEQTAAVLVVVDAALAVLARSRVSPA